MKRLATLLIALFAIFGGGPAIADDVISNGLTLTLPSPGSTNWADTFHDDFATPISGHDHTGSGKGVQISTNAIAANAVTESKIRLTNNAYLRERNAANSGDINICKVDTLDKIRFDSSNVSANTRADLGLAIGTNVEAWDADLDAIAALAKTDSNFIVGDGAAWVAESGNTARTSLGVGTGDSPTFTGLTVAGATVSGLTASSLVATDGSKALTSSVSGLSPTFTGATYSGLTASSLVATDGSKALTSSISGLSPTFTGATFSGLTASSLVATNGSKALTSTVSSLSPVFTGLGLSGLTASSLVATDGSKNLTSSVSGLSPTFTGLNLSGLTASKIVVTDGSKNLAATQDINAILNANVTQSTWTPTFVSPGGGSVGSVVIGESSYQRVGGTIFFSLSATFTLSGTGAGSTTITFNEPVSGTDMNVNASLPASMENNTDSTNLNALWRYQGDFIVYQKFLTAFGNKNYGLHIQGFYTP